MKASFDHIQYNALDQAKTAQFYKDLLGYFEMETIVDAPGMLGVGTGGTSFWVMNAFDDHRANKYDRDAAGLNHIGFKVGSREDVDQFVREFMQPKGIASQFETPRARTDFGPTYYQVMFVDPEGLAIEVYTA